MRRGVTGRLALAIVIGLSVVILSAAAVQSVETIVVVDPPPDRAAPGRDVALAESEESTPVGFIAGYLGLTVLGLTLAGIVRGGRPAAPGMSGHGSGIAYGRRSSADFWAAPASGGADRPPRAVPG